ncbi:DEAD/DEAH box helicase [Myxococcota bacterium]|nr:DEAD/DEAH box helicase [Myxococcota bacterium]MBU1537213.1 DEAD/DEAH box helicase [Myxococcota bacterium]
MISSFIDLDLIPSLQRAVREEGYFTPTPIQSEAIPYLLEGRDLLGCAQTGTGKTAAFALPILQYLSISDVHNHRIRALVLTPTRELAAQIDESFRVYGRYLKLNTAVIFGGVGQFQQEKALKKGIQILVATPGRLLDLMNQGIVRLDNLEVFVLDEADRMLDMGFIHDVKRVIAALPAKRQSLFFSATMPPAVSRLASSLLTNPVKVEVVPQATPADHIDQCVMFVEKSAKRDLLSDLLAEGNMGKTLIFTRTKHMANKLSQQLTRQDILAGAIHGNKSQNARTQALAGFRNGELSVLVATDIAARGIDVEGITHVVNFELPNEPESYVHRIGRTARAGAEGIAISFCSGEERAYLKSIEALLGHPIPVVKDHEYHSDEASRGYVDGAPADNKPKQREPRRPHDYTPKKRPWGTKVSASPFRDRNAPPRKTAPDPAPSRAPKRQSGNRRGMNQR